MPFEKSDFTPDEWSLLRDTPHLVAAAVASAGQSGLAGTLKEAMVACQQVYAGQSGAGDLVGAISTAEEAKLGQASVRETVPLTSGSSAAEKLRLAAIERFASALKLLGTKLPSESDNYGTWVIGIAKAVAEAAKEGTFLGFGGQRVSDGEAALLAELEQTFKTHHSSETETA
jgi:hypothetical protein